MDPNPCGGGSWGGFRWSIARTARAFTVEGERPLFSERVYATTVDARRAAWQALTELEERAMEFA
jgi:hypothetical protein